MIEKLDRELLQISNVQGVTHAKVLTLPQPLRRIIHRLMKKGRQGQMSLTELAQGLQTNEDKGQQIADLLIEKGYLYGVEHPETGELVYGVRFGQKRGRDLPLDLRNALQSLKPIQLIEVKSDLGAGTRGSDLGSDALKMASWQLNRQLFANYPTKEISSQQGAIVVNSRDLATMAATLANGGINPVTGEKAIGEQYVQDVISVLLTCGMYDASGEWTYPE